MGIMPGYAWLAPRLYQDDAGIVPYSRQYGFPLLGDSGSDNWESDI